MHKVEKNRRGSFSGLWLPHPHFLPSQILFGFGKVSPPRTGRACRGSFCEVPPKQSVEGQPTLRSASLIVILSSSHCARVNPVPKRSPSARAASIGDDHPHLLDLHITWDKRSFILHSFFTLPSLILLLTYNLIDPPFCSTPATHKNK
jgi:hypothetical protein